MGFLFTPDFNGIDQTLGSTKQITHVPFLLTFSIDESLSWGCIRGRQLLFDLGDVLGVKVVKQALTYQVILERREKDD